MELQNMPLIARAHQSFVSPVAEASNKDYGKGKTVFPYSFDSPGRSVLILQRTIGNQSVKRLFKTDRIQAEPRNNRLGALGIVFPRRQPWQTFIQRVRFGNDGRLSTSRRTVVQEAARIAERRVLSPEFRRQWRAFWSGPGTRITPRPTLQAYQRAVQSRVIHDMDSSTNTDVQELVRDESSMPLERQTAGVTHISSVNTYLRRFAIDQGIDSVVNLILHESLHGAGLPMGPFMMYEPLFHAFEESTGFPMMMGGADILNIRQTRRGDYNVDVTINYNLRRIDDEPLSSQIEIQVVDQQTGDIVFDEQRDGTRVPARHSIPSREGRGRWIWHARYPGWITYAVRIYNQEERSLMASRHFDTDPRCVLGVSSRHCN
jgi:hypothetical protein